MCFWFLSRRATRYRCFSLSLSGALTSYHTHTQSTYHSRDTTTVRISSDIRPNSLSASLSGTLGWKFVVEIIMATVAKNRHVRVLHLVRLLRVVEVALGTKAYAYGVAVLSITLSCKVNMSVRALHTNWLGWNKDPVFISVGRPENQLAVCVPSAEQTLTLCSV